MGKPLVLQVAREVWVPPKRTLLLTKTNCRSHINLMKILKENKKLMQKLKIQMFKEIKIEK